MINHHNWNYAAGPTFPEAVGDRYYAQDLARDYWADIDDAGKKVAGPYSAFPVLIKDSNVKKGTTFQKIDIPIAKGIVEFEVDVPNSYAALPPTVTQEDIYCRIETTAQTDFDISGTATLDGATTNYVKITYNETNGASRTRAKKAGSYVYEKAVSFTITVDSVAPTNKDLVLATLVGNGTTSLVISSRPRTRHLNAAYDYVVSTQDEFNIIIDRVAANQYKIKDGINSVFCKFLSGGYQMTGSTSPLQEGDTYGYIQTNQCEKLSFESGTFLDFHQSIGYMEINSIGCVLENVDIRGDKGAAAAIQRSFLLNASYVQFHNCVSTARLTNTAFSTFEGGTAFQNDSSAYIDCKCYDIDQSGAAQISVFNDCKNIIRPFVTNIENTNASGSVVLFDTCQNIDGPNIRTIDSTNTNSVLTIFKNCDNINNYKIIDIDLVTAGTGNIKLIDTCTNVNNGYINDIDANDNISIIFSCNTVNNTYVATVNSTGGNGCNVYQNSNFLANCRAESITSTGAAATTSGFVNCFQLSNCRAITITGVIGAYGFFQCQRAGECWAETVSITGAGTYNGYHSCNFVTASFADDCENGFYDCDRLSVCNSINNAVDGFDTCYTLIGCEATGNTTNGFDNCFHMEHNRSTGNGTQYSATTWADYAGARAAAATDSGGDNA